MYKLHACVSCVTVPEAVSLGVCFHIQILYTWRNHYVCSHWSCIKHSIRICVFTLDAHWLQWHSSGHPQTTSRAKKLCVSLSWWLQHAQMSKGLTVWQLKVASARIQEFSLSHCIQLAHDKNTHWTPIPAYTQGSGLLTIDKWACPCYVSTPVTHGTLICTGCRVQYVGYRM